MRLGEQVLVGTAAEALLRASTHASGNCTVGLLSAGSSAATDQQWQDEFLKLDGPELDRVPLSFASTTQVVLRMGRIAMDLQKEGSGLITPIEVERFSDGVRLLFRPKPSGYSSSAEVGRFFLFLSVSPLLSVICFFVHVLSRLRY